MKSARVPVYYPVDHHANFSGYLTEGASSDDLRPWPLRWRIGIVAGLSIVGWAAVLSPFFLIG